MERSRTRPVGGGRIRTDLRAGRVKPIEPARRGFSLWLNLWYAAFFIFGCFALFLLAYFVLANSIQQKEKEIIRAKAPECTLEAQDFRNNDTELIYVCYRSPYADVFGIDLNTRKVTVYRKIPDEYNEVEGIFPDGKYTLVESSREQGGTERQNSRYIDIWKLKLEPNSTDYVRMTHWGEYEDYKASNPVVSPDGKWFAFQSARNNEPAGVGHGIFLYKLN